MRSVSKVDAAGVFVTDVLLEDGQVLPSGCVEERPPEGFHAPKWTGSTWEEGKPPGEILEDLKAAKVDEMAARAGNAELGRAAFVAAEQRGLGDLMARYFDRLDPEARTLYAEWTEIPPAEAVERQRENVGVLLPEPDPAGLMPFARATT
jgi:hypothetical protein